MTCFNHDSLYGAFVDVIRVHYHCMHNLLNDVGLYPGQPHMLFALVEKDGQSQRELAERIKIKPATITVMISRMEKVGLVERKADLEDQRVSRVYIKEKGKEVCEQVKSIVNNLEKGCFENFTQEEQELLKKLLMHMKDNLNKLSCAKK